MEYCVQCGNALSSEAKFCPKCGAPVKRELYTAPRPKRGITSPSPIRENPVLTCRRASKKAEKQVADRDGGFGFLHAAFCDYGVRDL